MLVCVYSCQNATLLEISCRGSYSLETTCDMKDLPFFCFKAALFIGDFSCAPYHLPT